MNKLSIAYFGSPDFSADFLEKLITDVSINQLIDTKLVVTQPDQPVGRKQILTPTPVKTMAEKYRKGEDTDFSDFSISEKSRIELTNIDLALVYAFGEIIPKEILDLPKYGFWNIHPSLLPKYRGTSPIATPLINGDKTTGVTIIKMDEKIDHGPIIAQESLTIEKTDKRPDLEKKLTDLAFEMFKKLTYSFCSAEQKLSFKKQGENQVSYAKKLSKHDGFIEFEELKRAINPTSSRLAGLRGAGNSQLTISNSIYNLFRGLYPWPGIWTMIKPIQPTRLDEVKRLKITDLDLVNGKLIIKKVQLEGKKEVDFETFNKAYKIF